MDWRQMNYAMNYLASTGTVFSVEQRASIHAALKILQQENQFQQVHFLGKILGTESDYWIVCGIGKDYLSERTYFYSKNLGTEWVMLPKVNEEVMEMGLACRGHFTGDPTADCETDMCPEGDEVNEADDWITIKEEERLSATILKMMEECAVVPRGGLIKSAQGIVFENKMFEGLTKEDGAQLQSYYHVRKPVNPWDKNIVCRSDYNLSLDFLDPIAFDFPTGCWSIQIDKNETFATLRTMYWPGFLGFHQLGTQRFGWIFLGTGKKNWDVPFMMTMAVTNDDKNDAVEGGGGDFEMETMKGDPNGETEVDMVDAEDGLAE